MIANYLINLFIHINIHHLRLRNFNFKTQCEIY